jgi:hypothetical protein
MHFFNVLTVVFFVIAFLIAQGIHLVFEPSIGPFSKDNTATQLI